MFRKNSLDVMSKTFTIEIALKMQKAPNTSASVKVGCSARMLPAVRSIPLQLCSVATHAWPTSSLLFSWICTLLKNMSLIQLMFKLWEGRDPKQNSYWTLMMPGLGLGVQCCFFWTGLWTRRFLPAPLPSHALVQHPHVEIYTVFFRLVFAVLCVYKNS